MKPLPEELAREVETALGREVPPLEDREGWKGLAKEVATRAPHLYRQLMDALNEAQVRAVRSRPEPRSARPPGLRGAFYVRDRAGNWIPSRPRVLAAIVLGAALSTAPLLWFMALTDAKQRAALEGKRAGASVSAPAAPPSGEALGQPSSDEVEREEESGRGAQAAPTGLEVNEVPVSTTPVEIQPPPPAPEPSQSALPEPPPDLPPPPDYEGPSQQAPVSVVYRRPAGSAGDEWGGAVDLRGLRRAPATPEGGSGSSSSDEGVVYAAVPVGSGDSGVWVAPARKAQPEDGVYVLGRASTPPTARPPGEEVYVRKAESAGGLKAVYTRPDPDHSDKP